MSVIIEERAAQDLRRESQTQIIDCDVHAAPANTSELERYMPSRWHGYSRTYSRYYAGWLAGRYPRITPAACRRDAWSDPNAAGGSDLALVRSQLLDVWDVHKAVLTPKIGPGYDTDHAYSAAFVRAINEWQFEWLDAEERLLGSIQVAVEDADAGAAEVHRAAADPRFVQVLSVVRTLEPLGRKKYWPIYQAAVDHNLPVAFHFGGNANPTTGAGWASFYYEDHTGMSQAMAAQILSLVFEGVFERFPTLKVVMIEAGFAWFQALCAKMDESYARHRDELPHLMRLPSQYAREHFFLTTQPMEEPTNPRHLESVLRVAGIDQLMFASDYPHWDFDAPDQILPKSLPIEMRQQILFENARRLYNID